MEKKYAIFIDGDNISPSYLEPILTAVLRDGDIHIKRLYGDWTTTNMSGWKKWLEKVPIKPVQQFRNGPNATDNAIIMDAIEIANSNKNVNSVCIVSTDSDYYSLAIRLREYGLYVLGIGKKNANTLWVQSCNEFIYIEDLYIEDIEVASDIDSVTRDERTGSQDKIVILKLIISAYNNSNRIDGSWVNLADIGRIVKTKKPDFTPKAYGYDSLREFIASFPQYFELQKDNSIPPRYWMKLIQENL